MSRLSPTLRRIFRNQTGIRAGWSILIFLAILAVPGTVLNLIARHYHLDPKAMGNTLRPLLLLAGESVAFALILAATAIMARIERRSVLSYGLIPTRLLPRFTTGAIGGFACLSLLIAVLAAGHFLAFDGLALHGAAIAAYALTWSAAFLAVALVEETLFRGYLQSTLTRGMGFWPAAFITSILFGAAHIHNQNETVLGLAAVVVCGLVFCLLLKVSGSLWMGIGFHAAWDWSESYFYGTPDSGMLARGHLFITHAIGNPQFSGASAGPEGSVLSSPAMIAGLAALAWLCRRQSAAIPAAAPQAAE